jgi:hypothetical protein
MTRRARIPISLEMFRLVLDLPRHLAITGAYQTAEDRERGVVSVEVAGPFCPETSEGSALPSLEPEYERVACGETKLTQLRGLDT